MKRAIRPFLPLLATVLFATSAGRAPAAPFRVAFVGGPAHAEEFSSVPRALLCGTKETGVHLICVNPTDEAAVVNDAPKMPGVPDSFALPPAGVAIY